jgi:hypothetical protein
MDNKEEYLKNMIYVVNENGNIVVVDSKNKIISYRKGLFNRIYEDIDIWIGNNGMKYYRTNLTIKKYNLENNEYFVNFTKLF